LNNGLGFIFNGGDVEKDGLVEQLYRLQRWPRKVGPATAVREGGCVLWMDEFDGATETCIAKRQLEGDMWSRYNMVAGRWNHNLLLSD